MAHYVMGVIDSVLRDRPGIQEVTVTRDDQEAPERAYVVNDLVGFVAVGDRVLMNVTAVELGLGTGGWHFVSANMSRGEYSVPGGGHIMKLRYTPMQIDTGATAEHLGELPKDLGNVSVVACTVHSQVPLVVLGALSVAPALRIAYVMTDGAALPIAMSGIVERLRAKDMLRAGTITAGHAFGGDREAVGIPDALALARHDAHADLIVVGMGPGVVGTGHVLGNTALEAVSVLDFTEALGGRAILCVRASQADARERHLGMSHHSTTVLDLVRSSVVVPLVAELGEEAGPWRRRHKIVPVLNVDGPALLSQAGMRVTTMGRDPSQDRLFFDSAAAAGVCAVQD